MPKNAKATEPKLLDITTKQKVGYCVPDWLRDEQIRVNMALPWVGRIEGWTGAPRKERIALVNFGPSLQDTWKKLRRFKYVMTCSGAHKFCVERGIVPCFDVNVDPRAHKVPLLGTPQKETEYLVAATCHPDLFKHLEGYNVKLWHIFDNTPEGIRMLPFGEWSITGGCSVGVRLLTLARFLGFTKFEVFGMDGCIREDGPTHAAEHPNAPASYSLVEYDGKMYRTTPAMLEAARNTWHEMDMLTDCTARFHGEGLVQEMAKKYVRKALPEGGEPAIALNKPELISAGYRDLNSRLHTENLTYGVGGGRHAETVMKLVRVVGKDLDHPPAVLDYGAGKGYLQKALPFPIFEYDPCIPGKEQSPKPAELVVATDVLEHIEPERLDFVLQDMARCVRKVGYFVISLVPAQKTLPDGTNTHRIIQTKEWWQNRLSAYFKVAAAQQKGPELYCVVGPKKASASARAALATSVRAAA